MRKGVALIEGAEGDQYHAAVFVGLHKMRYCFEYCPGQYPVRIQSCTGNANVGSNFTPSKYRLETSKPESHFTVLGTSIRSRTAHY